MDNYRSTTVIILLNMWKLHIWPSYCSSPSDICQLYIKPLFTVRKRASLIFGSLSRYRTHSDKCFYYAPKCDSIRRINGYIWSNPAINLKVIIRWFVSWIWLFWQNYEYSSRCYLQFASALKLSRISAHKQIESNTAKNIQNFVRQV